jgi:hypothetical protein
MAELYLLHDGASVLDKSVTFSKKGSENGSLLGQFFTEANQYRL